MKTLIGKRVNCVIIFLVTLIGGGGIYLSPNYLVYSDTPQRSDAVMILDGPDYIDRRKEAVLLYKDRYAKHIFIPGHNIFLIKTNDGTFTYAGEDSEKIISKLKELKSRGNAKKSKRNLDLKEKTHNELIRAKLIMDEVGIFSVIFVSNPYHMRRVKIIAGKVFEGSKFKLYFVPSRFSKISTFWVLHKNDIKWIFSEYLKIAWFWIYTRLIFQS
jgi:hypothetical protein